ncbi:hypothetical protein ACLQ2S_09810 [Micromonospora sp. DT48]|uniref:hypothetical protein n=1 Tax=unclassified Micromonospora TaxID=2617518 RepID=UPI0012BBBF30|nr:hypothetical protein [Micromonospora sp. CP22]MTK02110.1 hypothetical protein [Micromonospora sp. CP22]
MGKIDKKRKLFGECVEEYYRFLLSEPGFTGPEVTEDAIFFHSPGLSVEILQGRHFKEVNTMVCGTVAGLSLRARVTCLYVSSGVGPAQDVSTGALTNHALQKSLRSQAEALRRVLPYLTGSSRDEMLRDCHGNLLPQR